MWKSYVRSAFLPYSHDNRGVYKVRICTYIMEVHDNIIDRTRSAANNLLQTLNREDSTKEEVVKESGVFDDIITDIEKILKDG